MGLAAELILAPAPQALAEDLAQMVEAEEAFLDRADLEYYFLNIP